MKVKDIKEMKIREINVKDIDNIVDFIWNVQIEFDQIPSIFQDEESKEIFKSGVLENMNKSLKFFGAFEENKMIGIIGFDKNNILYLYVLKEYQGKNIGTVLLRFTLELLREYDTVLIETVETAKKFYKKNGFKNKNNNKYDVLMEYKRKKFRIF